VPEIAAARAVQSGGPAGVGEADGRVVGVGVTGAHPAASKATPVAPASDRACRRESVVTSQS
jgi:hypothetical protein